MSPQRIQMTRREPWRHLHPDAVIVARPTKFGNPFRVGDGYHLAFADGPYYVTKTGVVTDRAKAVDLYCQWLTLDAQAPLLTEIRERLAGRDLACWCPISEPCHASVLLQIANT